MRSTPILAPYMHILNFFPSATCKTIERKIKGKLLQRAAYKKQTPRSIREGFLSAPLLLLRTSTVTFASIEGTGDFPWKKCHRTPAHENTPVWATAMGGTGKSYCWGLSLLTRSLHVSTGQFYIWSANKASGNRAGLG